MTMPPNDYYQRLQLSKKASLAEIKAAFRRLARRCHPDLNPNDPSAHAAFRALREAYDVLSDTIQRQYYDQRLQHPDRFSPTQSPEIPEDFYLRGINRTLSRRYQAALEDFSQAIEGRPDFLEAYLRRSQVRYVLGDDAGVLADCQRALQLSPNSVQAYYYQGLARYRLGYTQSAIAAFDEALTLEPDDPQTFYQRGVAYEDIQDIPAAVADFQAAAEHFQNQGDLIGARRVDEHLSRLQTPVWKPGMSFQRPRLGRLGRKIGVLFSLLVNPTEQLLPVYGRLTPRQASETGILLALIANGCFTLSGYELRLGPPTPLTLMQLWLTGSSVFLSLLALLSFSRHWFRRRAPWAADIFIAGATLLPLGLFSSISLAGLMVSPWLWLLILLFAISHTVLTLYSGCTQIQHYAEQTATWIIPSLLFLSLGIGYLTWTGLT
jgi:tetratricopeptide (TPR) repeat protein